MQALPPTAWQPDHYRFGFRAGMKQVWQAHRSAGHNGQNRERAHGDPRSAMCGRRTRCRNRSARDNHRGKRNLFRFGCTILRRRNVTQCIADSLCVLEAICRIFREAGQDKVAQCLRQLLIDFDRRLGGNVALLVQNAVGGIRLEGPAPGKEFVHHDADRIDI